MKITRQFTLVLLCCVIAFAGLTISISYQVLAKMQEGAALNFLETTSRFAGSIMNDQTHEFEAVGAALLAASDSRSAATSDQPLPSLATLQSMLPHLSFALIVDSAGRVLGATDEVRPGAEALFNRYLDQMRNDTMPFIGSLDILSLTALFEEGGEQIGRYTVSDPNGTPLDEALANIAVIANTDRSRFLILGEVVNRSQHYPDRYSGQVSGSFLSYVVDNHRIATNLAVGSAGDSQLGTPTPVDVTALTDSGYLGKELSPAGYYYYYLYTPVRNWWGEPVAAKAVGIREAVYSELIHNNIWAIVMVTLVAVPLVVLVAQLISQRITRPLKTCETMAEAIMAGAFRTVERSPVPAKPVNEADRLVASLRTMAMNLDESQQRVDDYTAKLRESEQAARKLSEQLLDANENLEAAVGARTLELQQLVKELSISNSTKTRFIANISHELKTPLTSSISAAELLLDELFGPLNEKQREYLTTIKMSSSHLLMLISDILSLAKIDEGRATLALQTIAVAPTIAEVVKIVLGTYPQRAGDITVTVEPANLSATADPAALRQILFNLLTNAVKFSDEGSSITVRAQERSVGEIPTVEFAVEDAGIGIAEVDHERVFHEFEQVDNSYSRTYEGTGLGLPIARRQTELHNGRLWLASELGHGTTITFYLPTVEGDLRDECEEEGAIHG